MKSLYFCSTGVHTGKSLVIIGIGLKLKKRGIKLSYLKPLGVNPKRLGKKLVDESAILMQELLDIKEPLDKLCPVILTQDLTIQAYKGEVKGLKNKVIRTFEELSKGKDIMLVEGAGGFHMGTFLELSNTALSKSLDSMVILIDRFEPGYSVDNILGVKENLGERMIGVVMNRVPFEKFDFVKRRIRPFLKTKGIEILGLLPQDDLLSSITVMELKKRLGGEILCCQDKQEELIERFSVGAMNVEKALDYFKRSPNKAVITGGDRPDIQLASLETSTKALILTGNFYPNDIIIAKAEEKGVPIVLVKEDTLITVEKVESALRRLEIKEPQKIKRGVKLIEKGIDFSLLSKKIRLKF